MKTPKQERFDDFLMDESDDYLLKMAEELKQDLSEIKVSEDLIARTLAKVSEQAKDDATKAESNVVPINDIKAPVKNRRRFQWIKPVSVAVAACFVLLLGANVAKNGLFGEKKDSSSDSSAYEMQATEAEGLVKAQDDKVLKSAGAANTEESATVDQDQYSITYVAPEATTGEAADNQDNEVKITQNFTGAEANAYSKALEQATNEAGDQAVVYEYPQNSEDNSTTSLLTLLTSDELTATTLEATDEWQYYLVFSLGEEDAVTYQIGKSKFVIATSYHGGDDPSQVVYEMKNVDTFLETLTGYLK
jgi:hypothetical protein